MLKNIANPTFIFKIPLNAIKEQFGQSEYDMALEEIHFIICQIFGSADFQVCSYIDDGHDNDYFHVLCCEVAGIDTVTTGLVESELKKRQLMID